MNHQIKITISDELFLVIRDYADNHDCTIATAAADICAIGAETLEGRAIKTREYNWGGQREGAGRPPKE